MNLSVNISALLEQHALDSFLVTSPINIRYLTGFHGVSETEREAFLLLTKHGWHLFTFQLYEDEAKHIQADGKAIEVHFITPEQTLSSLLSSINDRVSLTTIGIESHSLTYYEYEIVKKALPHATISPTQEIIEILRMGKSPEEIQTIRNACEVTDRCFAVIQSQIRKEVSEKWLAWKIEQYIKEEGYTLSFPPIVAFTEHASIPHHQPSSSTTLTPQTLILLDFGATVDGYHADMTRMLFYGTPKDEWVTAYTTLLKAQEVAMNYLNDTEKPSGKHADELTRSYLQKAGYPAYPHSLGHGVGLEIHELPRLSAYKDMTLEVGQVYSVEPGIYLSGKFGMRIEDLVLKTKKGIDVLSKSSKEIIVLS